MNAKEAIEKLKLQKNITPEVMKKFAEPESLRRIANAENEKAVKMYDVAIEALEKQIPEKPQNTSQLIDFCANRYAFKGDCPKCNKIGLYSWTKYCPECGQALDWEEHQEE